jgi:arsenite-transporting ATPase
MAVDLRRSKNDAYVAVCSTDPAPSLDDVFEQRVGGKLQPVGRDPGLLAAEIDAPAEFHAWAARMKEQISGALSTNSDGIHVDLSFERLLFEALLDIVPPGLDEVFGVLSLSALLRANRASHAKTGKRFKLILDMAPTGHALELLRTPERILHWSRLLLKSLAKHRTLPFARDIGVEIAQFASDVRWLSGRLHDRAVTTAWIVMLAEPLPDRETERLIRDLSDLQIPFAGVVVNRLLMSTGQCPRCRLRQAWQFATLGKLKKSASFRNTKTYALPEQTHRISGLAALAKLAKDLRQIS